MKPVSPEAKDTSIKVLAVVLAIAIWAVAISDKQRTSPSPKIELVVKRLFRCESPGRPDSNGFA